MFGLVNEANDRKSKINAYSNKFCVFRTMANVGRVGIEFCVCVSVLTYQNSEISCKTYGNARFSLHRFA